MQWEHLTAPKFAEAVRDTGVCVLAMGVLERHSEHLPVGTDFLVAHRIACLAAEKELAVVFPPWYFGQIYVGQAFPGNVSLPPTMLLELIESVLDEIGRNGFRKIILHNGHGGNSALVRFLAQCSLWREKPYSVYVQVDWRTPERQEAWDALLEGDVHGHACECETSVSLAVHPDLVDMDAIPAEGTRPLGRLKGVPHMYAGVSWYSDFPEHYAGDARAASAEKGKKLLGLLVDSLAEFIAAVKADEVVPALEKEFFGRAEDPLGGQAASR